MSKNAKRVRVLVVEDDVDTLVVFGKALSLFGIDGVPVATCAAARDAVATVGDVAVIVTDVNLPDGDGLALAKELRQILGCCVAVMSGDPLPDDGLPDGIDLWLQKPVGLPQLRAAVEALASST